MRCSGTHLNLWFKNEGLRRHCGGCPSSHPGGMEAVRCILPSPLFDMPHSRTDIRRAMRAQRRGLTAEQRMQAAASISAQITTSGLLRRARHIAVYLPQDGEVDLRPLIARLWRRRLTVLLPVLHPLRPRRLWFAPYHRRTVLTRNRYGIPEPRVAWRCHIAPWALGLVLAPLVAFDACGNRIGMGGGYYDATFAALRTRRHWRKPRLCGVAYAFQQVEQLKGATWDVPLATIITELGIIHPPHPKGLA